METQEIILDEKITIKKARDILKNYNEKDKIRKQIMREENKIKYNKVYPPIICECGMTIHAHSLKPHLKTKKHELLMKIIN